MTLEIFSPLLLWTSLLGCGALTVFLLAHVSSKKAFFGASLALFTAGSLNLFYGIANRYTGEGINEAALFHIQKGIAGLTPDLLMPLFLLIGMVLAVFGGLLTLAWFRMKKRQQQAGPRWRGLWTIALLMAILPSPGLIQPAHLVKASLHQDKYQADLEAFSVNLTPEQATRSAFKKVVVIYAEGLEQAFLEEERFPGLTPNLNRLRSLAMNFRGIRQAPFTGWTIAGQVATQCGQPVGNGQNAEGLEKTTCLGDLFSHQGFSLSYLNSSQLSFAGKGDFWKRHGYDRLVGYEDVAALAKRPNAPKSEWGPYDDTLFEAAYEEYRRLEKQGLPFVLTLLTVDTHANEGYPTPSCQSSPLSYEGKPEGRSKLLKAVHCSDRLIGNFIDSLLAKRDPDLMIVLLSDHVQPKSNDAQPFLPADSFRENTLMVWSTKLQPGVIQRKGSPFDVYPTLADIAGLGTVQAGLGRSLLQPTATGVEHFGQQGFFDRIRSAYSLTAEGFWQNAKAMTSPPPSN